MVVLAGEGVVGILPEVGTQLGRQQVAEESGLVDALTPYQRKHLVVGHVVIHFTRRTIRICTLLHLKNTITVHNVV